jgi:hypothetical protein
VKGALITGTILSMAVTAALAWLSALTVGPSAPLHLTWQRPLASYVALAAAPTGKAWELFIVTGTIFAACFLVAGLRQRHRAVSGDG